MDPRNRERFRYRWALVTVAAFKLTLTLATRWWIQLITGRSVAMGCTSQPLADQRLGSL